MPGWHRVGGVDTLARLGTSSRHAETDVREFAEPRLREIQAVLDASGAAGLDSMDVFDLALAPAYLRALLSTPMAPSEAPQLVDNLIAVRDHRGKNG